MYKMAFYIGLSLLVAFPGSGMAQGMQEGRRFEAAAGAVNKLYQLRPGGLGWCKPGEDAVLLRRTLMTAVDSADRQGLSGQDYFQDLLQQADSMLQKGGREEQRQEWSRWFTAAALAYGRDLYAGGGVAGRVSYDGISARYQAQDEQYLVQGLCKVHSAGDLRQWLDSLAPGGQGYGILRDSLAMYRDSGRTDRCARLSYAINLYRWMHHFGFGRMIVVNIPSAELQYFTGDSLGLRMKIVAGQLSKRTPRFAAWCDGVILYPYWNVPQKIAISELLPILRKAPELLETMEMELVDGSGRKVDGSKLSWASFTKSNFPYRIRQTPGCNNALGVIKFNIVSPYDVYMHDTNLKGAFSSAYRYYSHGCIRLERPLDLGRALLQDRLDTTFLLSCFRDQKPLPLLMDKPVPVFVIYQTVGVDPAGKLAWYRDVYRLGY